jgi:hypothetical protein
MRTAIPGILCTALLFAAPAWAQTQPPIPPEKSLKLSEIIARIEQRDQFRFINEIDWDEEGFYDITYYTSDKAKVEIKIDPVTGEPRM